MKFGHTVFVDVSPEYFYFTMGDQKIRFATFMNVKSEKGQIIPIAIGEEREIPETTLVNILDFDTVEKLTTNKTLLLEMVLEYGIGRLFEKYWFPILRPILVFRGHVKLRDHLGQNYKAILEPAALRGGARKVQFE